MCYFLFIRLKIRAFLAIQVALEPVSEYLPLYTVSLMMPRRISNDAKSFPSLPAEPCQAGLFCNSFGKETCKQHELMSQACLGESLINQNLVS